MQAETRYSLWIISPRLTQFVALRLPGVRVIRSAPFGKAIARFDNDGFEDSLELGVTVSAAREVCPIRLTPSRSSSSVGPRFVLERLDRKREPVSCSIVDYRNFSWVYISYSNCSYRNNWKLPVRLLSVVLNQSSRDCGRDEW